MILQWNTNSVHLNVSSITLTTFLYFLGICISAFKKGLSCCNIFKILLNVPHNALIASNQKKKKRPLWLLFVSIEYFSVFDKFLNPVKSDFLVNIRNFSIKNLIKCAYILF